MKTVRQFFAALVAVSVAFPLGAQMRKVEPLFPCSPVLRDAYGICSHITRRSMDFDLRHDDIAHALRAGAATIRSDFDFSTVFPKGKYKADNTVFDAVLESCDSAGMKLLPIIVGSTDKGWGWQDMDAYGKYVSHVAQRYAGRVPYWEIVNEINLQRKFPPEELASNYALMLREASKIIRAADGGHMVVFGGMGEADSLFLTRVCNEPGTVEAFDVMNFHSYNSPEELPRSFRRIADVMRLQGWEKPLWLTETGFSTPPGMSSHKDFWREVVPYACSKVGLTPGQGELAAVCDPEHDIQFSTEQDEDYFTVFRSVKYIKCKEIKSLDPKETPFLLAAYGEYFPKAFEADVVDYVRRGGTLICPNGVPFYYNAWTNKGYVTRPSDVHAALHLGFVYWWGDEAKKRGLPEIPTWTDAAQGVDLQYRWMFSPSSSARYLSAANLRTGDEFIPLILAGTKDVHEPVAAVYKLRSDLKGNIIIQTRIDSPVRNEKIQAQRVARAFIISFAYGLDRVFWYHLRAFEKNPADWESYYGIVHKDFSPKPAFHAYETLARMLPEGSTRPELRTDGCKYYAIWETPAKRRITALWSMIPGEEYAVKPGKTEVYDYLGRKVEAKTLELGAGVYYLVEE